mmetsp:Transcript_15473/g.30559  ORF Transcript_15473/g.30559 Transcript_15473/m.30559 type:complete len:258 (-) Transcript_15473:197-970(-)
MEKVVGERRVPRGALVEPDADCCIPPGAARQSPVGRRLLGKELADVVLLVPLVDKRGQGVEARDVLGVGVGELGVELPVVGVVQVEGDQLLVADKRQVVDLDCHVVRHTILAHTHLRQLQPREVLLLPRGLPDALADALKARPQCIPKVLIRHRILQPTAEQIIILPKLQSLPRHCPRHCLLPAGCNLVLRHLLKHVTRPPLGGVPLTGRHLQAPRLGTCNVARVEEPVHRSPDALAPLAKGAEQPLDVPRPHGAES